MRGLQTSSIVAWVGEWGPQGGMTCLWPAQVSTSLFHSYRSACVGASLYQPHRWQVKSKALALLCGKQRWGQSSFWELCEVPSSFPGTPRQALGCGHLRICISFVCLVEKAWMIFGGFGVLFWVFIARLWLSLVAASRGCSLVAVHELLTGVSSLVSEHGFQSGEGGWGLHVVALWLSCPKALWGLSSQTRDQTCISCISRWMLNHWTTREVPEWSSF